VGLAANRGGIIGRRYRASQSAPGFIGLCGLELNNKALKNQLHATEEEIFFTGNRAQWKKRSSR
jgi:hypothetical protein